MPSAGGKVHSILDEQGDRWRTGESMPSPRSLALRTSTNGQWELVCTHLVNLDPVQAGVSGSGEPHAVVELSSAVRGCAFLCNPDEVRAAANDLLADLQIDDLLQAGKLDEAKSALALLRDRMAPVSGLSFAGRHEALPGVAGRQVTFARAVRDIADAMDGSEPQGAWVLVGVASDQECAFSLDAGASPPASPELAAALAAAAASLPFDTCMRPYSSTVRIHTDGPDQLRIAQKLEMDAGNTLHERWACRPSAGTAVQLAGRTSLDWRNTKEFLESHSKDFLGTHSFTGTSDLAGLTLEFAASENGDWPELIGADLSSQAPDLSRASLVHLAKHLAYCVEVDIRNLQVASIADAPNFSLRVSADGATLMGRDQTTLDAPSAWRIIAQADASPVPSYPKDVNEALNQAGVLGQVVDFSDPEPEQRLKLWFVDPPWTGESFSYTNAYLIPEGQPLPRAEYDNAVGSIKSSRGGPPWTINDALRTALIEQGVEDVPSSADSLPALQVALQESLRTAQEAALEASSDGLDGP